MDDGLRADVERIRLRPAESLVLTQTTLGEGYDERVLLTVDERDALVAAVGELEARTTTLRDLTSQLVEQFYRRGPKEHWNLVIDPSRDNDDLIERLRAALGSGDPERNEP